MALPQAAATREGSEEGEKAGTVSYQRRVSGAVPPLAWVAGGSLNKTHVVRLKKNIFGGNLAFAANAVKLTLLRLTTCPFIFRLFSIGAICM